MFQNLISQVQAVSVVTQHLGGQVTTMYQQMLTGTLTSTLFGSQILLSDASHLLDVLRFVPDGDMFAEQMKLSDVFSMARARSRLEIDAEEYRLEAEQLMEILEQLHGAMDLLNVQQYQLSVTLLQLQQINHHTDIEAGALDHAVKALREEIMPEVDRLEQALEDVIDHYQEQLDLREQRLWLIDYAFKFHIPLQRAARDKWLARAHAKDKEEKEEGEDAELQVVEEADKEKQDAEDADA